MLDGDGAAARQRAEDAGDQAVQRANVVVRFMENPYTQYVSNFLQLSAGVAGVYFALADFGATAANSVMPDVVDAGVVGVAIWACVDNVYSIVTSTAEMYREVAVAAADVPPDVVILPV